ncbi:MAG: hypothetical protein K5650_03230 [Bacteroidales bacterium]|nr:hypothetical protein [Bacteroidales bacterium]
MKILPYKREKLTNGMHVRVSQHFKYTSFGVRDSHDMNYHSGRYVSSDEPGVGFFARETSSHSYHNFVSECQKNLHPSYFKMLLGREPSFAKISKRVSKALENTTDPEKKRILETYYSTLGYAKNNEYLERVMRGIKDMLHGNPDRTQTSVLNHYKNTQAKIEREMNSIQLDASEFCSEEQFAQYAKVVAAFEKVAACRRVWVDGTSHGERYKQVFLDLGIFDFIKSPTDTPIFRTAEGVTYYLYPNYFIKARNAVDFEIIPLKGLQFVCNEANIANPMASLVSVEGDIATILSVPAIGLTYYFSHRRVIEAFANEINGYIANLL